MVKKFVSRNSLCAQCIGGELVEDVAFVEKALAAIIASPSYD